MKCNQCDKPAVYRNLCLSCHADYVEETVKQTIQTHNLCTTQDKLLVAVSGGKDSQVVLHILHKLGHNVHGLLVNEGIDNYREPTMIDMADFCKQRNIPLKKVTFQKEIGTTLDNVANELQAPPCSACGAWRRKLLNKFAKDFDYVVTGHNMDDEAQSYLMNIFLGRVEQSLRISIKTKGNGFTKKIKPLYFLGEKDIRLYTLAKGFSVQEDECPYAHQSFRFVVRDLLNDLEVQNPGAKRNIVERFVNLQMPHKDAEKTVCKKCGQPSMKQTCTACQLQEQFVDSIKLA